MDGVKMPSVSVVIPHFWKERQSNILTLYWALQQGTLVPSEIIVWNNDQPFPLLPRDVKVIQAPFNVGCKARFLAAMCASSEYILFQDNDLMVQPQTVAHLVKWHQKLDAIGCSVALEGRQLRPGKPYSECEGVDGAGLHEPFKMTITLGRMELVRRDNINEILSDIPFTSETVMDDIWFSHALDLHGCPRWCVPYVPTASGFTNINEGGVGAYRRPAHWTERNILCQKFFPELLK
jgi:hypothetical protein